MHLPLEFIVAIVVAWVCERLYGPEAGGRASAAGPGALLWPAAAALLTGGLLYLVSLGASAWTVRRLRLAPGERPRTFETYARLTAALRALLVAAYAAFAVHTGWPGLVVRPEVLDSGVTLVGDNLLQLAPFLLGCLAVWLGGFGAARALSPGGLGLGEHLRGQFRGLLFLLGPWLVLETVAGSERYWPAALAGDSGYGPAFRLALPGAVLAAVALLYPFYVVRLWPHRTLPRGPLRERLERLLGRSGTGCRDLVVWDTGRSRMANAAVIGLAGWCRYIVFTDALLEDLDAAEVEGVLGHELGHVRYGHMAFYLLFFVDFLLLSVFLYGLLPEPVRLSVWAQGWLLVAMVVVYWRFVFGFISRRFERQADAASCELAGGPAPLVSALEKLAAASGGSRTARNWRHSSVAERVAFLSRVGPHPEALREHHAHVRTLKIAGLAAAALLGLVLYREWSGIFPSRIEQLESSPDGGLYQRWYDLGEDLARDGQRSGAWECYERVTRLNPSSPDGYLGQARLSLDKGWDGYRPSQAVDLAEEAARLIEKLGPGRNRLAEALKVLAEAHFLAENPRAALETGDQARALDPQDRDFAARVEVYRRAADRDGTREGPGERKSL